MGRGGMPLGEWLASRGLITRDQLGIALTEQKKTGKLLGELFVTLGFVSAAAMREAIAEKTGTESVELPEGTADAYALAHVPRELARRFTLFPLAYDAASRTLTLAMAQPTNLVAHDQIRLASRGEVAHIEAKLASPAEIDEAIDRHYGAVLSIDSIVAELEAAGDDAAAGGSTQPVIRLIDALLSDAVLSGASDIHFEPELGFVRIRYRIDGVLSQIRVLHKDYWPAMAVRLKVMSGLNIAETRAPQDGRMTLTLSGREIDFRIAVLPVLHGENVVLRVLDRARGIVLLDSLGLSGAALHQLRLMLARPEGMVVVTGPTGSGKTTTLYSMLSHLNDVGVNIMTLEDPVEYPLPMVRQTPVNEAVKLDFASGIRALMRQDPDIILVGEIRDTETASMAFRAAMTGHQVFATLHTHSALGALARLADLGVLPDMMAGNISGVIGQRLVRVLCVQCKTASTPDDVEQRLLFLPNSPPPEMIFRPVGCPQCRGTGYRGRRTVMEVLRFDEEFDALVGSRAPLSAFRALVAQREVMPLADAAVALVRAGETALEEVLRVVDLTGRLAR